MNTKNYIFNPILDQVGKILRIFKVYPFSQLNNYALKERSRSILPKSFDCNRATPLCYIMKEKGTDKALYQGCSQHNYTTFYYAIFKKLTEKPLRIFELGLGTTNPSIKYNMGAQGKPGASLRGWKTFFPHALVCGADIDKSILFEEDRIKTFYTDQTDPKVIQSMWKDLVLEDLFDIIIDDGMHEFNSNRCFFENSIHKLNVSGVYIIEDISNNYISKWEHYLQLLPLKHPELRFSMVKIPNRYNNRDNNLLVFERLA